MEKNGNFRMTTYREKEKEEREAAAAAAANPNTSGRQLREKDKRKSSSRHRDSGAESPPPPPRMSGRSSQLSSKEIFNKAAIDEEVLNCVSRTVKWKSRSHSTLIPNH